MENGPYQLEDGQMNFNSTFNIWSWNQFANVLYFESPAGVGFSPAGPSETTYNDIITTQDNYYALLSFFTGFPELLQNQFWVSGESYAGIYVPFLAAYIDDQNKLSTVPYINLQGVLVGNGVASYDNNLFTQVDFFYGHYFIPDDLYYKFYQDCGRSLSSPSCNDDLEKIDNLTAQLNPYDIYRYCFTTDNSNSKNGWLFNQWIPTLSNDLKESINIPKDRLRGSDVPCLFTAGLQQYLNKLEVKQALHVDPKTTFAICNLTINENYVRTPEGSIAKYKQLMNGNYKILIYSGDTDAAVPYTSTIDWIENLNLGVKEAWRPYYIKDQVIGFVTEYNGLTFATVKGVGHQVPAWKRQEGYLLVKTFIDGKPLPKKNSKLNKKTEEVISL